MARQEIRGGYHNTVLRVIEDEAKPVGAEIIAAAIVKISEAAQAMMSAGLKQETIITLIHDNSKVAKRDIRLVLNNLEALAETHCSKKVSA